ncbi:phosphatidic acid phosphatase [Chloroflexota bacterium]
MRKQIASLTSNILNPFLVGLVVILLVSFESTSSTSDAIKWSIILMAVSILPVFLIIIYLVHSERVESISIKIRRQRNKIYLLASSCVTAGCIILLYMGAPLALVAAFVAGLSAIIVFMFINLIWKISVHTAFVAASVTTLTILYGSTGAFSAMLIPPVAWSRIELEQHSFAQVTAGALLATLIVFAVFHFFGMVGSATTL